MKNNSERVQAQGRGDLRSIGFYQFYVLTSKYLIKTPLLTVSKHRSFSSLYEYWCVTHSFSMLWFSIFPLCFTKPRRMVNYAPSWTIASWTCGPSMTHIPSPSLTTSLIIYKGKPHLPNSTSSGLQQYSHLRRSVDHHIQDTIWTVSTHHDVLWSHQLLSHLLSYHGKDLSPH